MNKTPKLKITSWNIAAINNNPFEYWLTLPSHPEYNQIMIDVENFILNPGVKDVKGTNDTLPLFSHQEHPILTRRYPTPPTVSEVFTEQMFTDLESKMTSIGWSGIPQVRKYWEEDYSKRTIIEGFLKDKSIGSKRLASMPDRITNTLNINDGIACRPTVINMYEGDLGSLPDWWKAWSEFMFEKPLVLSGQSEEQMVYEMLSPIKKSKYPAISEEEEVKKLLSFSFYSPILTRLPPLPVRLPTPPNPLLRSLRLHPRPHDERRLHPLHLATHEIRNRHSPQQTKNPKNPRHHQKFLHHRRCHLPPRGQRRVHRTRYERT